MLSYDHTTDQKLSLLNTTFFLPKASLINPFSAWEQEHECQYKENSRDSEQGAQATAFAVDPIHLSG